MKSGLKSEVFRDLNQYYNLTCHDVWHAETPAGPMAVVLHEGLGSEDFMQDLGQSDHSFDVWMKDQISEFRNMNFNEPPGPTLQKLRLIELQMTRPK